MQTIYLDISNKGVVPTINAKQGDVGRKFNVYLTNGGVKYTPTASQYFSVWYDGESGSGNYTEIGEKSAFSVIGNVVTVEMITQMLTVPGDGEMCLVLNDANGDQIGSWNIPYFCEEIPGADSEVAKDYYTAFSKAVSDLMSGGGGIGGGLPAPSTAEAGQIIKVSSVDASGKVTATEAVTLYIYDGTYKEVYDGEVEDV